MKKVTVFVAVSCLVLAVLLLFGDNGGTAVFADDTWTYLPYSSRIDDIVLQDDYIWADTNGGLVRWYKPDGSYEWFTEENGLLSNSVGALYADSNKNLWVGTSKGIQRFDGTAFTTLLSENDDFPELSFNGVVEAGDGTMWFAGYPGVRSFDGTAWTTYTSENSGLLLDYTRCITIDNEGVIWISYSTYWTDGKKEIYGVASFDGSTWQNYSTDNSGLGTDDIDVITVDSNNIKWFGSQNKDKEALWSFDGTTWTSYENEYVTDITEDISGTIWVASGSWIWLNKWYVGMPIPKYPLKSFDGSTWTDHYYDEHLPNPITGFWNIEIDPDGTQWFVTGNNIWGNMSLHSFDGSMLKSYYTDGPRDHTINDVIVDNNNDLWIATRYGISKYDGNTWKQISFFDDPSLIYEGHEAFILDDIVSALSMDKENYIWTVTFNGLRTFDGTTWKRTDVVSDVEGILRTNYAYVLDIAVDQDNVKWTASSYQIESYDGETWQTHKFNEVRVRQVAVDLNNVKWFGSLDAEGGAISYDGTVWNEYCESTCPKGTFTAITVDQDNVKWFGTNEGVWSFDGTTWTAYEETIRSLDWPESPVIRDNQNRVVVQDIVVDDNNTKWICVYNMIVSFDGNSWRSYAKEGGEYYKKLAVDHDNVLWMVGRNRIERIDLTDIEKYAGPTGVDEEEMYPEGLAIIGNYPNPFNPSTTIGFSLTKDGFTELVIYNITGQKIRTLVAGTMNQGVHSVVWNGLDDSGLPVSAGVYLARLTMGDAVTTGRMILVK